jgi:TRAP-type mannitol/chloroaromatic compound transport system substrate-binding protein
LALAGVAGFASTAGTPETLVMPIAHGSHLPGFGQPARALAKMVKERSGGSIELLIKEPGDGTQPHQILEKVSSGKVDAGFATAALWAAKLPAGALFAGFPFGPDAETYAAWYREGGGRKLYQDMYDQAGSSVHVLPCAFAGAETAGWFGKELQKAEDLKGFRMRIFGLGGRVMLELGAEATLIGGSAVEAALGKKEIDGAELLTPAADALTKLPERAKLIYEPGWHQPETVMELLINKDRWKKMSPAQQTLIETACRDLLDQTREANFRLRADALEAFRKKGVKIETLPDKVITALREAWAKIAKEEGENDFLFQTVVSDLERYVAERGKGGPPGRTPPPAATKPQTPTDTKQMPAFATTAP